MLSVYFMKFGMVVIGLAYKRDLYLAYVHSLLNFFRFRSPELKAYRNNLIRYSCLLHFLIFFLLKKIHIKKLIGI